MVAAKMCAAEVNSNCNYFVTENTLLAYSKPIIAKSSRNYPKLLLNYPSEKPPAVLFFRFFFSVSSESALTT